MQSRMHCPGLLLRHWQLCQAQKATLCSGKQARKPKPMPQAISAAPAVPPKPTASPHSLGGESTALRCSLENTRQQGQLRLAVNLENDKLQSSQSTADLRLECDNPLLDLGSIPNPPRPPNSLSFSSPPTIALLPASHIFISEDCQTLS